MKIHEYQAKAILAKYDVPVPRGEVVYTVEEAEAAAKKLGGSVVVKAQIHAGGRGKGGGVKVAKSAADAAEIAKKMLGMTLVTHQTGPEGRVVQRLLIEETLPIDRELYLGLVLDRERGETIFMASKAGGVEIEEVAAKTPELILREALLPGQSLQPFQARKLAFGIDIPASSANAAAAAMIALSKAYEAIDGSLAEINPFILTKDGKVYALDAKINLDDNALYRHKDLLELRGSERRGSSGSGSLAIRAELYQAGRQYRLHGEWRRAGDGDHGHYQIRRGAVRPISWTSGAGPARSRSRTHSAFSFRTLASKLF